MPLGSIPELPADSCVEIKANERGRVVSGSYTIDYTRSGNSLLAYFDMKTNGTVEPRYNEVSRYRKNCSL